MGKWDLNEEKYRMRRVLESEEWNMTGNLLHTSIYLESYSDNKKTLK